jgi:Fur family ferric uptake transcriptional regulator
MQTNAQDLHKFLQAKKLQWTSQREIILREIFGIRGHFDAEGLAECIKAKGKKVSRATVYRTLPHLQELGLIREVSQLEGRAQYERVGGHHDHLVCVRCGEMTEFKEEAIERLQNEVCREHGFKPLEHHMSINGICSRCQPKSEGGRNDGLA